jgi:septal ring factor EnvC (AmiA/AmiB activator)
MDATSLLSLLNLISSSNGFSVTAFLSLIAVIITLWIKLRKATMEESTSTAELEGIRFANFTKQVDFLSKQLQETRTENEELRTQIKQLYEQNLAISNKLSYVQSLLDRTIFAPEPDSSSAETV